MFSSFVTNLDQKLLPEDGWYKTYLITAGVGTATLFLLKYYLSSQRAWCKNNVSLEGKTCIVTGGNTGIGKAVALEFAQRKGRVILACRDIQKANSAALDIRKELKFDADVGVCQLDLSSFASIRNFVACIKQNEENIHILVNNAGLMSCPYTKSVDGFEMQFAVNHLGHFLLTNLLLDTMKNKDDARIIVVSSSLYKKVNLDLTNYNNQQGYMPFEAYARSKLANILFAHELSKRLPAGITVNSMHPGIVWTELARHKLTNIALKVLYNISAYFLLRKPQEAAQTILYMATEPSLKDSSGKYFGDCRLEELKDTAKDDKMSKKLWEISEKLTGLEI